MFYGFVVVHHRRAAVLVPVRVEGARLDGARVRARRPVHHGARHPRGAAGGVVSPDAGRRARRVHAAVRRPVGRARRLAGDRGRGRARARSRRATRSCRSAITTDGRWLLAGEARAADRRATRPRCPAAFDGRRRSQLDAARRSWSRELGQRRARRRRRVPAAARSVRRGRHRAGPARARRPARTSASGVLGSAVGDGQDHDEAGVRGRRAAAGARTSRCATATTVDAFADAGRAPSSGCRAS